MSLDYRRPGQGDARGAGAGSWRHARPLSLAEVDALGRPRGPLGAAAAKHPLSLRRRGRAARVRPAARRRHHARPSLPRRPRPFQVRDFEDYREKLAAAYVLLDGAERRREIASAAARVAERGETAPARRSRPARRACRAGRMAGRAARQDRSALHGSARRGAGDGDAPPSEVSCRRGRQRPAGAALRHGGQHRGRAGQRRDRRRQRARAEGAALRCAVLLGSRPQATAREPGAGSGRRRVPCQARLARRQGGAAGDAGRLARRAGARGQAGARDPGGAAVQGRSGHRHGQGVPRAARRHGPALRLARPRATRGRRRDRRALRPARARRHLPERARERRRGARRQARHPGRLLRHRREADRLQGSVRPAPRRPGGDPADPGEPPASAAARGLQAGARGIR